MNSGVKNVYFFGVRNFEGQNHSGHPVILYSSDSRDFLTFWKKFQFLWKIFKPLHNGLFWFKKGHFRGFSKVGILDIGGTHWKALVFRFVKSPILGP